MKEHRWLAIATLAVFLAPVAASGQGSALTPAQAKAFMGTWVINMTIQLVHRRP
jgi:hypothetical protein